MICFSVGRHIILLQECYFIEWELFTFNSVNIKGVILLDWISIIFTGVVLIISARILYYRGGYMKTDVYYIRFFYLVLLFVGSIVLIILSPNFISILIGWDGLGLVSYCLVIYYQNNKSFNAGMITILRNRIGDIGLLIRIGWIISLGEWNFYLLSLYNKEVSFWVCLCILFAGLTKRAQLPFSAWLPAAIAAPTPVSALVHSSTLVTAGVYLMIRFYEVMKELSWLIEVLIYLAILTSLIAGVGANFEYDLKKIIALSTLSQLGLIIIAVSLGAVFFAYCHLLTHALFKALLFICAGKFIHVIRGYQDIRRIGSLINLLPLSSICFNIANLSLCGIPFLAGFYRKDLILEWTVRRNYNFILVIILFLAVALTCRYSFRVSWYMMRINYYLYLSRVEDNDNYYSIPILVLLVGAVFSGSFLMWLLFNQLEIIYVGYWWKLSPLFLFMIGLVGGRLIRSINILGRKAKYSILNKSLFYSSIWYISYISSQISIKNWLELGQKGLELGDCGWRELLGGQGMRDYFLKGALIFQALQNNNIKIFIFVCFSWFFLYFIIQACFISLSKI